MRARCFHKLVLVSMVFEWSVNEASNELLEAYTLDKFSNRTRENRAWKKLLLLNYLFVFNQNIKTKEERFIAGGNIKNIKRDVSITLYFLRANHSFFEENSREKTLQNEATSAYQSLK